MKEILLSHSSHGDFVCTVDDCDFSLVSSYRWRIEAGKNGVFYAFNSTNGHLFMHRLIYRGYDLLLPSDKIDHADRNGLNNQRGNLRKCNTSQNNANQAKSDFNSTSIYKGVLSKGAKRYEGRIMFNRKAICLGTFAEEADAAIAYDIKARELFGEFARLNFPHASTEDIDRVKRLLASPKRRHTTSSRYYGVFFSKGSKTWGWWVKHGLKNHQKEGCISELQAAQARDQYIEQHKLNVSKSLTAIDTIDL